MAKLGLILEFIGFIMLFLKTEGLPMTGTNQADAAFQIERLISWIPNKRLRMFLSRYWHKIALALVALGVFLQFWSYPK